MGIMKMLLLLCLGVVSQAKRFGCKFCTNFLELTKTALRDEKFAKVFRKTYYDRCMLRTSELYCAGAELLISAEGYPILVSSMDSEMICTLAGYCDDTVYIKDRIEDYTKRVLIDTPRPQARKKKTKESKKPIKFLAVGDIHIDYKYKEVIVCVE